MNFHKIAWKAIAALLVLALIAALVPTVLPTAKVFAQGKSLYVNKDLNANSPISAYGILPAPTYLTWQQTSSPTKYGGAGLAIDTDSAILFVTFESSGTLDIVDAVTLGILGTVTAPGASNLAGIVVDQDNQKVYAVDRNTDHLYVYSWDATTHTLTNDIASPPGYITLPMITATGGHGSGLHGIALDEVNDLLYVCDVTTWVQFYNTADWSHAGNITVSQKAMGIALDVPNQIVYTGNAYPSYGSTGLISKYYLATDTEATKDIQTLTGATTVDNVVGLAVDHATGLVYITTGDQGVGGSDRIIVLDSSLNMLHATSDIGNPTGIVVPGKPISYNPLNLQKTDGLADDACVSPGQNINYTISYDNQNLGDVTNVTITDTLPAGVTFVSATHGGTLVGNTVTWNMGTVPTGISGSVALTVLVNSSTPGGTTITNNSSIDCDQTGPAFTDEETDTCTNQPPIADAGPDQTVEQTSLAGADVTLDGSGSSDPDSTPGTNDDIISFEWYEGASLIATGEVVIVGLNLGQHNVTLKVTDSGGVQDTDDVIVTVVDTAPPVIDCVESVNPHGNTIPGEKASGKGKGNNPDGFYEISVSDVCDSAPKVWVGTEDDPYMFDLTPTLVEGSIVVKFTEASKPSMKKIGSQNGQAGAVTWHITLPGEPFVTAIDASGNKAFCICYVPPPPK